jgi:hypothetical protein
MADEDWDLFSEKQLDEFLKWSPTSVIGATNSEISQNIQAIQFILRGILRDESMFSTQTNLGNEQGKHYTMGEVAEQIMTLTNGINYVLKGVVRYADEKDAQNID